MRFSVAERHRRFAFFAELRENITLAVEEGFSEAEAFQIALRMTELRERPPLVFRENLERKAKHKNLVRRVTESVA